MAGSLSRWEKLEEYLFDHNKDGTEFTASEYAAIAEIDRPEASQRIQAYLSEQRSIESDTLYVLHRVTDTRTRSARWQVGIKTKDARQIGTAFYSDVTARVQRAIAPDLRRIALKSPGEAKRVGRQVGSLIDAAMKVLEAAVAGAYDEE
jgi:hypothetical protein